MTVPLVIVTGFLGAGKTTLINRLLARRAARGATGKLGLIVNELGAVGIDGDLLGGQRARQIELPGGCVCCVLGDDLGRTLLDLVAGNPGPELRSSEDQDDRRERAALEAIVLETTGVAEPLPIAWAIAREPVAHEVRLAAVVTLVDATNFLASRAVSASVDAQVAYADVLLVTKSELTVGNPDAERAESVARSLAPRALIRRGTADDHAAWLEALLADPVIPERESRLGAHGHAHVHDETCRHLDSAAAHGIDSVWLAVEQPVDVEELADQLAELPPNYVRIKGIVRAATGDPPAWFAVHRVGPRVSSEPLPTTDHQQPRIVALGPGVTVADLARCVAAAAQS